MVDNNLRHVCISVITTDKKIVSLYNSSKKESQNKEYFCLECNSQICVKEGLKKAKHFAHYSNKECTFFERNNESIDHLCMKEEIKSYLEEGNTINIKRNCEEGHTVTKIICLEEGETIILEYIGPHREWIADICIVDKSGHPKQIIEVFHTHKTNTQRPTDWVEVSTKDLKKLYNENNEYKNNACLDDHRCDFTLCYSTFTYEESIVELKKVKDELERTEKEYPECSVQPKINGGFLLDQQIFNSSRLKKVCIKSTSCELCNRVKIFRLKQDIFNLCKEGEFKKNVKEEEYKKKVVRERESARMEHIKSNKKYMDDALLQMKIKKYLESGKTVLFNKECKHGTSFTYKTVKLLPNEIVLTNFLQNEFKEKCKKICPIAVDYTNPYDHDNTLFHTLFCYNKDTDDLCNLFRRGRYGISYNNLVTESHEEDRNLYLATHSVNENSPDNIILEYDQYEKCKDCPRCIELLKTERKKEKHEKYKHLYDLIQKHKKTVRTNEISIEEENKKPKPDFNIIRKLINENKILELEIKNVKTLK